MTRVEVSNTSAISLLPATFTRDSSNSTYADMDASSSIRFSSGTSPGSNLDGWFGRPSPSPSGSAASGGSEAAGRGSEAGSSPRMASTRLPFRMCRAIADRQLETAPSDRVTLWLEERM